VAVAAAGETWRGGGNGAGGREMVDIYATASGRPRSQTSRFLCPELFPVSNVARYWIPLASTAPGRQPTPEGRPRPHSGRGRHMQTRNPHSVLTTVLAQDHCYSDNLSEQLIL